MVRRSARILFLVVLAAMTMGCSFHSVATHWNGLVGPNGEPVYVRRVTNIGFNLGIVIPLFGNITIDEMIDESTEKIAKYGSDHVRVIESSAENYWHGFPPFTWFVTPVITEVSVEYRPSEAEIAAVLASDAELKAEALQRREQKRRHIVPGPRR